MPPKSIFRQPGAQHFQLVHRSQRDPLINDPEASKHVLKPFERDNTKKGKSRAELESILAEESANDRPNVGEASMYGVYFDDTEYDYMQHLRPVGLQEDGVDSVLIEAPATSKPKPKAHKAGIQLLELPEGVLASQKELPRNYESQQAIPASLTGFQPDMDGHLRQVLEALEDDAFVDDGLEDDFFGELVADGERASDEDFDFEFAEEGVSEDHQEAEDTVEDDEESWQKRFADFKKSRSNEVDSDDECDSEGKDTVSNLPEVKVIGGKGKKRRKGTSEASGYSMSSSSMFRNEALQTLDERFDQMILKQYNEEDEEDDDSMPDDDDDDEAPELITTRDDFDSMINEFLNDYEMLGRKLKPKLEGETGPEKLDSFRRAIGQDERNRMTTVEDEEVNDDDLLFPSDDEKKDRWDCETILTTYTNVENHPRLIRARDLQHVPKITLDPKTGFPVVNAPDKKKSKPSKPVYDGNDSDTSTEENNRERRQTVARPKDETKEEKKARKAAVKAERQERRSTKKSMKEQFSAETKDQNRQILNKELRLKKL